MNWIRLICWTLLLTLGPSLVHAQGADSGPKPAAGGITGAATTPTPAPAAAEADEAKPGKAEAAIPLSIYKPILFLVIVGTWGWIVTRLDKDVALYFVMQKEMWNGVQMAGGIAGIFIWLLVPWFWLGLPLALLMMGGAIAGYGFFRQPRVPAEARWKFSFDMFTSKMEAVQEKRAIAAAAVSLVGKNGTPLPPPAAETPQAAAHAALEELLEFMLPRHGERIDIALEATGCTVTVDIDGVRYARPAMDPRLGLALVDYLKEGAGLDIADRRRKQTGAIKIDIQPQGRHTFNIVTMGSTRGLTLTFQVAPKGNTAIPLDKLGLLEAQRQQLLKGLENPGRVVIAACPPGQGMTNTLYSLISTHDPYTQSIVTLEEDVLFELEGVSHTRLDPNIDAAALNQKIKALLLRDTQVILLSRISDSSTAKMIAENATSARFYVGLRQEDTFSALRAWVKAVGDTQTAANSISAVVGQRLLRRLCTTCRIPYKPDPEMLRKLNLPPERVQQLYKNSGKLLVREKEQECPDCLGLGYRGRVGVFEVITFDDDARALLAEGQLEQLRTHLRKQRTLWLQEAAFTKAVEGVTSISEISRATAKAS